MSKNILDDACEVAAYLDRCVAAGVEADMDEAFGFWGEQCSCQACEASD